MKLALSSHMYTPGRSFVAPLALLLLASCSADMLELGDNQEHSDEFATFEEFKASLYCEPNGGACIIQGDIPVFGDQALRDIYQARRTGGGGALTVMRNDSVDAAWPRKARQELTYCVSTNFGERHGEVAAALALAIADWEEIAHVKFQHLSELDDECFAANDAIVFDVNPAPEFAFYFARAFFPDSPRMERQILVNMPEIDDSLPDPHFSGKLNLRGIFRHELGHVLGFRHEHIRPDDAENLVCFEDSNFRPLTEYDNKSVMHYPQCAGEGDWSLELTFIDQQGARFFYPDLERFTGERCTVEIKGNGKVNDNCAPAVREILELANTASFEILDDWAHLDKRAATALVDQRETKPFTQLQQLRDIDFIGPDSVRRMYNYLYVDGRCPVETDNEGRVDTHCRPIVHRVLDFANRATLIELDHDAKLDSRAAANILEQRVVPFTDVAALWSVRFVKTRALGKMYQYIYSE